MRESTKEKLRLLLLPSFVGIAVGWLLGSLLGYAIDRRVEAHVPDCPAPAAEERNDA